MKRQILAVGVLALGLLLFVFILAGMAAPRIRPTADTANNDSFDTAELISAPGYSNGNLSYQQGVITDVVDYYVMSKTVEVDRQYRASLNTLGTQGGLQLQIRVYDADREFLDSDDEIITWSAYTTTYYIRVEALVASTTTLQSADYRLDVDRLAATPTPFPTDVPTNTPPPVISNEDDYEDNNTFSTAYTLPVATSVSLEDLLGDANFYNDADTTNPKSDYDWYKFWGKEGNWYQVTTSDLSGVDTRLVIKDKDNDNLTSNDDGGDGYASLASFQAGYDGYYYVRVENKVNTTGTYDMAVEIVGSPEPQPTHTPGPGPDADADACEENADFSTACVIAANDPQTFNFVPPFGGVDNDFFKLWVKRGYLYECATSYLDAGVDPNMIVYTGPSQDAAIGGNDDVEVGDLNSYFSYYATYDGWLYLLLGYGDRTPSDIYNSNYTLECTMTAPGDPTATPRPTGPAVTNTPRPTTAAQPTATEPAGLTVRPLTTPTPAPETGPEATSEPQFTRIRLLIYYDANGDGQPGAGEGISDISVKAYESVTNEQLAQQFTDEQGSLEFTVSAQGPVRVSVPFFGFSQIVSGAEANVRLRVPFQSLPGGSAR